MYVCVCKYVCVCVCIARHSCDNSWCVGSIVSCPCSAPTCFVFILQKCCCSSRKSHVTKFSHTHTLSHAHTHTHTHTHHCTALLDFGHFLIPLSYTHQTIHRFPNTWCLPQHNHPTQQPTATLTPGAPHSQSLLSRCNPLPVLSQRGVVPTPDAPATSTPVLCPAGEDVWVLVRVGAGWVRV